MGWNFFACQLFSDILFFNLHKSLLKILISCRSFLLNFLYQLFNDFTFFFVFEENCITLFFNVFFFELFLSFFTLLQQMKMWKKKFSFYSALIFHLIPLGIILQSLSLTKQHYFPSNSFSAWHLSGCDFALSFKY